MSTQRNMPSNIEQRVMANVATVYSVRKVFSATALKLYVLVAALLSIWKLVWVTRIMQNFTAVEKNGLVSVGNYFVYAVVHTHPVVQLTLVVAAVAFVALVIDLIRSTSTPRLTPAW
jgi:hypothetical protein